MKAFIFYSVISADHFYTVANDTVTNRVISPAGEMRRSAAALSVISYGAFILLHGYTAFMYLFVTFDRAFSLNPDMCSQKLASVNS